MQINANISGLKQFAQELRGFERRFMGALSAADHQARSLVVKNLRASMESGSWAPNAEGYRRWKIAHGYDGRALLRTHLLRDSVSSERVTFSLELIHSRIGWPGGATYGGSRAKRASGKRQRRGAGSSGGAGPELQAVAGWLEDGARGPARPFIARTRRAVRALVIREFQQALGRSIGGIGGKL